MFTRSFIAALLSAVAYAQSTANPFKINGSLDTAAGKSLQLQWNPTTQGSVSLILRSGSSNNLAEGTTIAANIANSGSYTWNVPDSIARGSSYTVEIVSDSDPSETNYTPAFVVDSSNTAPVSMSSVSLGAPSSSVNLSTAAVTASPSAFPLPAGVTIDTVAHSSTGLRLFNFMVSL
ncbi:hypothetical protein DOTSEDRAFT_40928 [Dothistroma septosporum NZE10]|uniref:Yeast cell wall synthesis Kre9/Knh1-like N-terminal domain-containing protein n=1 Tax=Dothistroma septosporum (strain NZE10 / CBS 128990) TaxID=675120 RepID=N1Q1Z8_DOTSN|nr:hypothetical protein DOTSEDRAFT_40928 [Dothistroma septosporum NZE10]